MHGLQNTFGTLKPLNDKGFYYSLPELERQVSINLRRLPVSIRVMLESLLRNCDGRRVKEDDIRLLAAWDGGKNAKGEIPFIVSRVILQDFTGVPLIVDLAAMRDAAKSMGLDPAVIEPVVPVDLVVDHSVQVDRSGTEDAYLFNLQLEFERNRERYAFLKWGEKAFRSFKVVPPGIGIVHQVNLEYFASVVTESISAGQPLLFFDTLVGTDSHTTMVNGLGVLGWGVGGIEAQAAMLGQPVAMQMPEVIGVRMTGTLKEGVTATDLTLHVTQMLRQEGVVNKFVEFFGVGVSSLTVADRATIANMAPEYGATIGFFPVDENVLKYLEMTGREKKKIEIARHYLEAQGLFGIPKKGEIDFTKVLDLDLSCVVSSVSGPKRPQDRLNLPDLKNNFEKLLEKAVSEGGYGARSYPKIFVHSEGTFSEPLSHASGGTEKIAPGAQWSEDEMVANRPLTPPQIEPGYSTEHPALDFLTHGSIVIAAITSCTNTSNPHVLIGAGLLAKKAVEKGLRVNPLVKTSLAPGSRVVSDYLQKTGLQKFLDALGFQLVGYGCTTCIGNSGPLDEKIEKAIKDHDIIVASVLSGNRNFEARIHSAVKANFLMSPPLVVAFALAGRINIDFDQEALGIDKSGAPVFLRDIWPNSNDINQLVDNYVHPQLFKDRYSRILLDNPLWEEVVAASGALFQWEPNSSYIQKPPYFDHFSANSLSSPKLEGMRCLAIFGDSVTTDHISPAGAFKSTSPAGQYLLSLGVTETDFNSYGSRRGNHHVMMRGTFANVRIKNQMADGNEGGFTKVMPEGNIMPIFDASRVYAERQIPLILFAGKDYGMGSSRDWAAKGTLLLGVQVVVAQSFERIHRSNLVGMGVLPLEFKAGDSHERLRLNGDEIFTLEGLKNRVQPRQTASLKIQRPNGTIDKIDVTVRIDTPIEVDYYLHGGIMPFVLSRFLNRNLA